MAEEIVKIDKMEHSTSLRCVNQLTGRQQELYWQFVKSISRLEKEVFPLHRYDKKRLVGRLFSNCIRFSGIFLLESV